MRSSVGGPTQPLWSAQNWLVSSTGPGVPAPPSYGHDRVVRAVEVDVGNGLGHVAQRRGRQGGRHGSDRRDAIRTPARERAAHEPTARHPGDRARGPDRRRARPSIAAERSSKNSRSSTPSTPAIAGPSGLHRIGWPSASGSTSSAPSCVGVGLEVAVDELLLLVRSRAVEDVRNGRRHVRAVALGHVDHVRTGAARGLDAALEQLTVGDRRGAAAARRSRDRGGRSSVRSWWRCSWSWSPQRHPSSSDPEQAAAARSKSPADAARTAEVVDRLTALRPPASEGGR